MGRADAASPARDVRPHTSSQRRDGSASRTRMPESFCGHTRQGQARAKPTRAGDQRGTARSVARASYGRPTHLRAVEHAEGALDDHKVQEVQGQDACAAVRVLRCLEFVTTRWPVKVTQNACSSYKRGSRPHAHIRSSNPVNVTIAASIRGAEGPPHRSTSKGSPVPATFVGTVDEGRRRPGPSHTWVWAHNSKTGQAPLNLGAKGEE
jgi:hypothetical protein